ncbi:hypothetical protein AMAG_00931 [Allomyces macrogynus ATCC 38327]|uniref:C3H1-type domain-containing protein n=1 Tax=Allomyces macrogynus (strain ATCC 38327) TaxID=578462 RepID=A0A0L0RY37_ALLM3|nr:hypothetical protein AMAG_00931 [Allomyces macrogynus ATCC 38327]|eukprot:KNE54994.1 hypothetical protein AMAG_00931 [Allomyces macrogynus ATCC 38327]
MSYIYLGLAASAGAASVYVGRRLSVKLGESGEADDGTRDANVELDQVVVATDDHPGQDGNSRNGPSGPSAAAAVPVAPVPRATTERATSPISDLPPASPSPTASDRPSRGLSLDAVDPITLPPAPSVAVASPVRTNSASVGLPPIVEEAHHHAKSQHAEYECVVPAHHLSRSASPVSQENMSAASLSDDNEDVPAVKSVTRATPPAPTRPLPTPPPPSAVKVPETMASAPPAAASVAAPAPVPAPVAATAAAPAPIPMPAAPPATTAAPAPDTSSAASARPPLVRRSSNLNLAAKEFTPTRLPPSPPESVVGDEKAIDDADKPKKIRCAYWPNCKYSTLCTYWHPLEKCKNEENREKFPAGCVYGTRCFFYHEHEAQYLASIGIYPPYAKSLGIGPNTPQSSGGLRRMSSTSSIASAMAASGPLVAPVATAASVPVAVVGAPMAHPLLNKRRSMTMVLPPRPETGFAPGPMSPGVAPQSPGGPRRMRSNQHLRRESSSGSLNGAIPPQQMGRRPSRQNLRLATNGVAGSPYGSVPSSPVVMAGPIAAVAAPVNMPAPGSTPPSRRGSFNVHAPAFSPSAPIVTV